MRYTRRLENNYAINMVIGIDGNEANVVERVGVNTYAFELLKNIRKLQDEWKKTLEFVVYLKEKPKIDMPKETEFFRYKVIEGGSLWILTRLMPDLFFSKSKCDIFFSPSHYVPPLAPMPRVCSIMDVGYLKYTGQFRKKDFWQLKIWSAISIYVSKAIFAISNSTKQDIVRHYPSVKDKIYVISLAYDVGRFNTDIPQEDVRRVRGRYSIVSDYVLYLGTLKPSKNIEGLIEAFSKISGVKLVIAGKKGWLYQSIFDKVKKLGLEKRIIFTDFIPEDDKPALIKGAKLFVLPSFWEGFGLDALSAMACGVPVVASNVGSLPEVLGKAGIFVNPHDVDSIASGIEEVLSAPKEKYNSMVKNGLAQARKFSWEKTARETLSVLEQIK